MDKYTKAPNPPLKQSGDPYIPRVVGSRRSPEIGDFSPMENLKRASAILESTRRLAPEAFSTFMPKGVFRFKTHEEANRQRDECLARGMAELSLKRKEGRKS